MENAVFSAAIAQPHERLAACRLLTDGFPADQRDRAAHWLLSRFEEGLMNPRGLFIARNSSGKIVAAASLHLDGAAGATITSYRAAPAPDQDRVEDALIAAMDRHAVENGVKVCQLIGNPAKSSEYRALLRNGFLPPARLIEMAIEWNEAIGPVGNIPFELVPFREERAEEFAALLCATYEGTLDCPELNDVRTPAETLAGMRGNNRAETPYWSFVEQGGQPIGVLMLNPSEAAKKWELTYLGLVLSQRHKGLGKALVTVALAKARESGASGMILTTDSRNGPAIRIYEAAGFRACGSYDVFLKLFNR